MAGLLRFRDEVSRSICSRLMPSLLLDDGSPLTLVSDFTLAELPSSSASRAYAVVYVG
jgi:hypothetical protein